MKQIKPDVKMGPVMRKVLLCLYAGTALSLTKNPNQAFKIIKIAGSEWRKISRWSFHDAIGNLYKSKLVFVKEKSDGTVEMILSEQGRKRALAYKIGDMRLIKPKRWDNLWRLVIFDIPEKHKKGRDSFSKTIKKLGFHQLQKSVFIYPYDCQNELDFLIEFFDLQPFVRRLLVKSVDNELHLKRIFGLI